MKTIDLAQNVMNAAVLPRPKKESIPLLAVAVWGIVAALALEGAYGWQNGACLVFVYLFALLQMARAETWRQAFYPGLALGLSLGLLRLDFFWRIFSAGAIVLWLVFAFWIALFVALARLTLRWHSLRKGFFDFRWFVIPFLWCGLEHFRSELYYLRFSWLSPAFAFGQNPSLIPFHAVGSYGLGFLLMCVACAAAGFWNKSKLTTVFILVSGAALLRLSGSITSRDVSPAASRITVAGVQMEFPTEKEVLMRLSMVIRRCPEAEIIVLSEYTFAEPVPDKVRNWCREHGRYLIVGGKEPVGIGQFYNTAFVISTNGDVVFRQVKSVPIQFFKDGLAAPEQRIWHSPWGELGICICYDLSYSRVADRLVKLGAEALIVPTMDVVDWGERQHRLHSRIAPVRAAEYGLPIFRLASSGISQLVDDTGHVVASAPFAGEGAIVTGKLELRGRGHLPLDRWLAPFAVAVVASVILVAIWKQLRRKHSPIP